MNHEKPKTWKERYIDLIILGVLVSSVFSYLYFSKINLGDYASFVKKGMVYGWIAVLVIGFAPLILKRRHSILSGIFHSVRFLFKLIYQKSRKAKESIHLPSLAPSVSESVKETKNNNTAPLYVKRDIFEAPLGYKLPPLLYLPVPEKIHAGKRFSIDEESQLLTEALVDLNIMKLEDGAIEVLDIIHGPNARRITFKLPKGLRLSLLQKAQNDISNRLGIQEGLDIQSGQQPSSASILIPNDKRTPVYLSSLISSAAFHSFLDKAKLPIILGINDINEPVFTDLTDVRHLLVAGATGSGKSVCINSTLVTWFFTKTPEELQLILIDPKRVELKHFRGFPHVMRVVTDPKESVMTLKKLVAEVYRRYEVMESIGAKNIGQYQRYLQQSGGEPMPYVVCVIDELSELMLLARKGVEDSILSIAQLARAAGVHLLIATQRPSTDVITGLIKANLPSRISFRLLSSADYSTIFGTGAGGVTLLGKGDGLAMIEGYFKKVRFQAPTISILEEEEERTIRKLKEFWRERYSTNIGIELPEVSGIESGEDEEIDDDDEELNRQISAHEEERAKVPDEKYIKTIRSYVIYNKEFTVSDLQKILSIRRQKVLELLQVLVEEKILEPPPEGNPRQGFKLLLTEEERMEYMDNHPLYI